MKAKELWESGAGVWGLSDDATMARIRTIAQKNYYRACEYRPFPLLRRSVSASFDGTGTAYRLPADLVGITGVTNIDEQTVYKSVTEAQKAPGVTNWGWFYVAEETDPLYVGACSVDHGSTEITIHESATDFADEWVTFSGEYGHYLFSDATHIARTYYGPSLNYKTCFVRPPSQRSFLICDGEGDDIDDDVTVWYWVYPPPLYLDNDEIRLPGTRALELMVWLDIIGPIEKRKSEADGYRLELQNEALPELLGREVQKPSPMFPRGATGRILMFGRRR